jgi:hypothetical protein
MNTIEIFIESMKAFKDPIVVELGTKQSVDGRSTMHRDYVPHAARFLGVDIAPGKDVDFVHDVEEPLPINPHGIISCSTFEHINHPWLAARALTESLVKGGFIFVQTHHTFPIHAYPYDMWRFTIESLQLIFYEAGLHVIQTQYDYPCKIVSEREPNTANHPAFLNVSLVGQKK